jgi:hypothetical protein
MLEQIATQALDDLPPYPAGKVIGDVVAHAPHREQHHHAERYLPNDVGILQNKRALHETLHEVRQ